MALHSRGCCYATTRRLQHCGRPYQPKHNPSLLYYFAVPPQLTVLASSNGSISGITGHSGLQINIPRRYAIKIAYRRDVVVVVVVCFHDLGFDSAAS